MTSVNPERTRGYVGKHMMLCAVNIPEPFDFDSIGVETINNLGRNVYGDLLLLQHCPKPAGLQRIGATLWYQDDFPSCEDLHGRYEEKELAPNPWQLLALASGDPDFAAGHDVVTQWKAPDGKFCFLLLYKWQGKPAAHINWTGQGWGDRCLFSGSPVRL